MKFSRYLITVTALFTVFSEIKAVDVTKCQYDLACTGANTSETVLTPKNVNTSSFGKLFTKSVDGQVYAQPLYLQKFTIGGGVHNVVFICTEHNSIYAFDADDGTAQAFWHRTLPTTVKSVFSCNDLVPEVGITATPVIDRTTGALYVESSSLENGTYFNKLYAVNLADGTDLVSPIVIAASVTGSGSGSSGGKISFDSFLEFCRPGLLLLNGKIYLGFGSHCDDGNYHGWLIAYNANNLGQFAVRCLTPNASQGSIWQQGGGLSSDGTNIFCVTGNGSYGASDSSYGESAVKFDGNLKFMSSFTPYNYVSLNGNDNDLCSSCMLIPGSTVCTMQGKAGAIYVMNQTDLGGFNSSSDNIVQRIDNGFAGDGSGGNPVSAYWNNLFYLWAGNDHLRAYSFDGSKLGTTEQSSNSINQIQHAGSISVSADGVTNGILWGTNVGTGLLYAFDATKVSTMLWNDGQAANSRDVLGSSVQKYARPTVVNGKVYLGTVNSMVVYGLLNSIGIREQATGAARGFSESVRVVGKNKLSLVLPGEGEYSASLIDTRGRTRALATGFTSGKKIELDLSPYGLTPGAYCAMITLSSGRPVVAIVVLRKD
jgi:hypothetical protein